MLWCLDGCLKSTIPCWPRKCSMFQLCMQKVDFAYLELSTSTPPLVLLLSAFQPHLQIPKWCWQLEECTNTTAITFEVITNRVYYFRFGRSFECWGIFPMAIPWVAVRTMTVVEMSAAIYLDPHEQKPYHPESWLHTDYLLLLNSAIKSLWTVLFWQLNVAKLLSSFLGLFFWGGRDRNHRYFYENGYNWELTPYICNKEQRGEDRWKTEVIWHVGTQKALAPSGVNFIFHVDPVLAQPCTTNKDSLVLYCYYLIKSPTW